MALDLAATGSMPGSMTGSMAPSPYDRSVYQLPVTNDIALARSSILNSLGRGTTEVTDALSGTPSAHDLNMAMLDPYNTASNISLMRQHMGYGHIYDLNKLTQKVLLNTQYLAAMNPTAGSFIVNPRLQRLFATFAINFPSLDALNTIYATFLLGHLTKFPDDVQEVGKRLVQAALQLHKSVARTFRKTASNFHYEFNVRHVAHVELVVEVRGGLAEGARDRLVQLQRRLHQALAHLLHVVGELGEVAEQEGGVDGVERVERGEVDRKGGEEALQARVDDEGAGGGVHRGEVLRVEQHLLRELVEVVDVAVAHVLAHQRDVRRGVVRVEHGHVEVVSGRGTAESIRDFSGTAP